MNRFGVFVVVVTLAFVLVAPAFAASTIWLTIDSPSTLPTLGSTFATDLEVSSWNGVIGALDIDLRYDPAALRIVMVDTPADSPFTGNCAADKSSFASGRTRIACFQVAEQTPWATPLVFGTVTWHAIGVTATTSTLSIEGNRVVEASWLPAELQVQGQSIVISILSYLPLLLQNAGESKEAAGR